MKGLWDVDSRRVVEPQKRMVGGRFGWAVHRFPIKGGKTMKETVVREWQESTLAALSRPNPLFARLTERRDG